MRSFKDNNDPQFKDLFDQINEREINIKKTKKDLENIKSSLPKEEIIQEYSF